MFLKSIVVAFCTVISLNVIYHCNFLADMCQSDRQVNPPDNIRALVFNPWEGFSSALCHRLMLQIQL